MATLIDLRRRVRSVKNTHANHQSDENRLGFQTSTRAGTHDGIPSVCSKIELGACKSGDSRQSGKSSTPESKRG